MKKTLAAFAAAVLTLGVPLVGCSGSPSASAETQDANTFAAHVEKPAEIPMLGTEESYEGLTWQVNGDWTKFDDDLCPTPMWEVDETMWIGTFPSGQAIIEDGMTTWESDGYTWVYGTSYSDGTKTWYFGAVESKEDGTGIAFIASKDGATEDEKIPGSVWAVFNSLSVQ